MLDRLREYRRGSDVRSRQGGGWGKTEAGQLRVELAMRKRNERGDAGQPCCLLSKAVFTQRYTVIRFSGHGMRYFWRVGYRPAEFGRCN
jgi:hypothetical protein